MICPHCGKDIELVYVMGEAMTREQALHELSRLTARLDRLLDAGAFQKINPPGKLEKRYDEVLALANLFEIALGL